MTFVLSAESCSSFCVLVHVLVIVLQLSVTSSEAKMAGITQPPWLLVAMRYFRIIGLPNVGRAPIVTVG